MPDITCNKETTSEKLIKILEYKIVTADRVAALRICGILHPR
jgi:hypothetical protein